MFEVEGLKVGIMEENCYVVYNEANEALIIDPGDDMKRIIAWIEKNRWQPVAVLLTHTHSDHIGAVDGIRERYDIEAYVHEIEQPYLSDPKLNMSAMLPFGDVIQRPAEHVWTEMGTKTVAGFDFEIAHVPGHSPGHVIYTFHDDEFVICGDTVFESSIGRTDFPNGSFEQLLSGINEHILSLADSYKLYPGHGPNTTVSRERANNPFLESLR